MQAPPHLRSVLGRPPYCPVSLAEGRQGEQVPTEPSSVRRPLSWATHGRELVDYGLRGAVLLCCCHSTSLVVRLLL